ncbi:hypothetical protein L1987_33303 [Smallanthus sonchifolius]|uniref:Uncharacterized protein n=1 Tax=Smallanthus sonchifolius TaxID=185202 RepID=A0ACB9HQE0_9ASTR|nr:hypothetical protein L1987_33303 [Smallanthus sonchifolius]
MPNTYYEIVTGDLEKATKKGCKDVKAKNVKSKGKGYDQARIERVQEAVDIELNQADKFKRIEGVAGWEGHSEKKNETEGEEAAVADQVKVTDLEDILAKRGACGVGFGQQRVSWNSSICTYGSWVYET